jgi:hypothetical protein
MLRRLPVLLTLMFLTSLSARAQNRIELFGGYSFQRFGTTPGRNLNGWELSGSYKLIPLVSIKADLDAQYVLPSTVDTRTLHLMVGPQFNLPTVGRFSPFAHVLGGFGHLWAGQAQMSVAAAVGGGIDMPLAPLFSWRLIQADYLFTRFPGGPQHNLRFSTGLVFHF